MCKVCAHAAERRRLEAGGRRGHRSDGGTGLGRRRRGERQRGRSLRRSLRRAGVRVLAALSRARDEIFAVGWRGVDSGGRRRRAHEHRKKACARLRRGVFEAAQTLCQSSLIVRDEQGEHLRS